MAEKQVRASPDVPIDRHQLRQLRHLNGLTQEALAKAADVTGGYIAHLENGHRTHVSPGVFARLCDALGVTDRTKLIAT